MLLGDALIVYAGKLEKEYTKEKNHVKLELLKLDVLGKMITGEDLKLSGEFEKSEQKEKKINQGVLKKAGIEIVCQQ